MKDKLLNTIKGEGLSVQDVVEIMNDKYHVKIGITTFYRKLRDFDKFKLPEIKSIALILKLNVEQTEKIFFTENVA